MEALDLRSGHAPNGVPAPASAVHLTPAGTTVTVPATLLAPAGAPDFLASATYTGSRPGYVFTRREQGQGYYKDTA